MKKILNILFVCRSEVENKWWHRLASVAIYGSTILVMISVIILFVLNGEMWKKYSYSAFNFESKYVTAVGEEVECTSKSKPFSVSCAENPINSGDLVVKYNKIIRDKIGADVIKKICVDAEQEGGIGDNQLTQTEVRCIDLSYDFVPISDTDFATTVNNQLTYNKYLTDEQLKFVREKDLSRRWDLKAKRTTEIIYPVFFKNLAYVVLSILIWFIFWESIVYRTLLYVIYGRKK